MSDDPRKVNRALRNDTLRTIYLDKKHQLTSENTNLQSEINSDFVLYFKKYEKRFKIEDSFEQIFPDWNFDEEMFLELLWADNFDTTTWDYLSRHYEKYRDDIKESDSKSANNKVKNSFIRKIKRFLKEKTQENKDLGIDHTLSIHVLKSQVLDVLAELFQREYFEWVISENFSIESFLQSNWKISEYISWKYDLTKLQGAESLVEQNHEQTDDFIRCRQQLANFLPVSKHREETELEQALYGASIVRQEILDILA